MAIRKTTQQIKEEILSSLNNSPLSIEKIRKKVDSNWSTINTYLKELKEENKVKEILSTDKAKIYQRIFGDTYFDLPITEEQRKKFRTLFYMIKQMYKSHGKVPTKTHLAKCAVHVIDNKESELNNLPIVWYLYGIIPQMVVDPMEDYQEDYSFKNKVIINSLIKEFVNENEEKGSIQIQEEQHKKYGEELYVLSDEFFKILNKSKWSNTEIEKLLNKFFIACPVDQEFPEIFDLTEKVFLIIEKMSLIDLKLQDYRKEILLTFDSLWKLIALYKLYISKTTGQNPMKKEIVLKFYLGSPFEDRKRMLKESFSDLNSIYITKLVDFDLEKIQLSDEVKEIRKIMQDWTGED